MKRNVGGFDICYRLLTTSVPKKEHHLLITSQSDGEVCDMFIPFVHETKNGALKMLEKLYRGKVTPTCAEEVIDALFDEE